VFPDEPERSVFNNAVLERDLGGAQRTAALDALANAYASTSVDRYAAWVHESDEAMRDAIEARGYALVESTRAMGLDVSQVRLERPDLQVERRDWQRYLDVLGVPDGLLTGVDPGEFGVLVQGLEAAAMTFDHHDDCGVFNVGTIERVRRRGLATALTALAVHEAADRGCRTATLQSTPMAERVYAAVGFRDLGRFLEYAP